MDFSGFEQLDFPQDPPERVGEVYVLLFVLNGLEKPFYVGQTMRFAGRMDDYFWAQFTASTDFKVGKSIKHLRDERGCQIIVRHKPSSNRLDEEKAIIRQLSKEKFPLLNSCPNYDYKTASEDDVLEAIRGYCDKLIAGTV